MFTNRFARLKGIVNATNKLAPLHSSKLSPINPNLLLTKNSSSKFSSRYISTTKPTKNISTNINVPILTQLKYLLFKNKVIEESTQSKEAMDNLIKLSSVSNPIEALQHLEKGWTLGILPLDENYLKTYIALSVRVGKFDDLDIKKISERVYENLTEKLAANTNANYQANVFFASNLGSFSKLSSNGTSPNSPLYLATVDSKQNSWFWQGLTRILTMVLLAAFTLMILEELEQKDPNNPANTKKKTFSANPIEIPDKSFNDVVGIDDSKAELEEIVMFLKDPSRFTKLGGTLPKGVLLTGPPGTGKTLLAKAIAGEAGVPFFHASGSEFDEIYVGVGAKRIRELFEAARQESPAIIFIDEIDAFGGTRHLKENSASKMTLNQLLVEMDGFKQNSGIIVIAATNLPKSLDPALIRPGRFDKQVNISLPDVTGRKKILEYYSKRIPIASDVDLDQLARGTAGFSGAELQNLLNQAAIFAALKEFPNANLSDNENLTEIEVEEEVPVKEVLQQVKDEVEGDIKKAAKKVTKLIKKKIKVLKAVNMESIEYARDKILLGAENKGAVYTEETLRTTAFHEAGHALVSLLTPGSHPIHKATIVPRGNALGMVMHLPDSESSYNYHLKQMYARLDVCLGGRVAEELFLGENGVTTGASSDFSQATRLAKKMITHYGLSEKLGVMVSGEQISDANKRIIDLEVRRLVDESHKRVKKLLMNHYKELEIIANALLEFEIISGDELKMLLEGKKINAAKRSYKTASNITIIPEGDKLVGKIGKSSENVEPGLAPQPQPLSSVETEPNQTTSS